MTHPLSPAAQVVWEAFNLEEASVFVDYGDKLAAALRALADQVVPKAAARTDRAANRRKIRSEIIAIATELEAARD